MSKHDPLATQLESLISEVVIEMEQRGSIVINPANVALKIDQKIDPESVAPVLKTYLAIMQIREKCRGYLARKHDPVKRVEEQIAGVSSDMFSDKLQDYYPAKRKDARGEIVPVYVLTESATDDELLLVVGRMRKVGKSTFLHADALEAYVKSRGVQAAS